MSQEAPDEYFQYADTVAEVAALGEQEGGIISPGGVAQALGCSRENVRLLERRGQLRGRRMRQHRHGILGLLTSRNVGRRHEEVFIFVNSVRDYANRRGITLRAFISNHHD